MSLIFNEAALNFLLQSPAGPVGRSVERVSNHIAGNYEAVINIIWQNQNQLSRPHADYRVESGDNGLQGDVGIPDQGHVSEYMDEKFGIESDWIVPGLMTNWEAYV
jgi:hypothetical protein